MGEREPGFPGARNWFLSGFHLASRLAVSLAGGKLPGLAPIGGLVSCLVVDRLWLVSAYARFIDRLAFVRLEPGFCLDFLLRGWTLP